MILASDSNLNEWDFTLPVGSRPSQGFVGLKNAGATCYMNSVLQQLFMIRSLRTALLSVKIPPEYGQDESDEDELRRETVNRICFFFLRFSLCRKIKNKVYRIFLNLVGHMFRFKISS